MDVNLFIFRLSVTYLCIYLRIFRPLTLFFTLFSLLAPSTAEGHTYQNMVKIWVADDLGQIKSCSFDRHGDEASSIVSEVIPVVTEVNHDRSDYVQIMAHANWETPEKSMV